MSVRCVEQGLPEIYGMVFVQRCRDEMMEEIKEVREGGKLKAVAYTSVSMNRESSVSVFLKPIFSGRVII